MVRIASTSASFPAALAAVRQGSSTKERSPPTTVTGTSSWPTMRRRISTISVALAPVEPNRADGGVNRSRPIASAAAMPFEVSLSPSLSV